MPVPTNSYPPFSKWFIHILFRGNTRYPVRGKKAYPGAKQKQDPASSEDPSEAWVFLCPSGGALEGTTEEAKSGAAQAARAFEGPSAAGRQWNEDWWGMGRIMILPLTNRSPITARNVSSEHLIENFISFC